MIPLAVETDRLPSRRLQFGIPERVRMQLRLKLALYLLLSLLFCVPYFIIQRAGWLHPRALPASRIDEAIGYQATAIYVYQSVYLLIPLFPFLSTSKEELFRFAKGFIPLCAVSFAVFLAFPIYGPRPAYAPANWMTRFVFSYDRNLNVFPSLHVGLATYSLLFGFSIARIRWLLVLCSIWLAGIMYSTLATKQHYFMDLPPALLLAWISHRWAWWRS